MDKARRTEIVDSYLGKMLQDLVKDYPGGQIKLTTNSNYEIGEITISVK